MTVEEVAEIVGFIEDAVTVPLEHNWERRRENGMRTGIRVDAADKEEDEDEETGERR